MRTILTTLALCLCAIALNAEVITLYNDNGQGGIHKSSGKTIVIDGQYYVDMTLPASNGKTKTERHKVYRVNDNARLLYYQPKWAEKYAYVVEANNRMPYYFNMTASWKPSLTEDPNDHNRTIPQKKLTAYRLEDGRGIPMTVVLVKCQGRFLLYTGDGTRGYTLESNDITYPYYYPDWARRYKYISFIKGYPVFFNISD